jgi:hypothetical protein
MIIIISHPYHLIKINTRCLANQRQEIEIQYETFRHVHDPHAMTLHAMLGIVYTMALWHLPAGTGRSGTTSARLGVWARFAVSLPGQRGEGRGESRHCRTCTLLRASVLEEVLAWLSSNVSDIILAMRAKGLGAPKELGLVLGGRRER